MSDEVKAETPAMPESAIRGKLKARRAAMIMTPTVVKTVPGLGDVQIRRLTTRQQLDLFEKYPKQAGVGLVLTTVLDEFGAPLFASADEVRDECDFALFDALLDAVRSVNNRIDVDAAASF